MDSQLVKAYKETRRENPTLGAVGAVRLARWRMTEPELPFTGWDDSWKLDLERDGFKVRVRVDYDYDASLTDWMGTFTDEDTGVKNPQAWYLRDAQCSSFRQDDRGVYLARLRDRYGYIDLAKGYRYQDHRDWARSAGMSRSTADEYAREHVARDVAMMTDEGASIVSIVVHAYREGIELGSASLGGIDLADWSTPHHAEDNARWLSEYALELIDEGVEHARESLARLCPVSSS